MPWKVLRLGARAEADDILGRPEGTPLYPERLSPERMRELEQADTVIWNSLYMQREVDYGGRWFGKEQLQFYRRLDPDLLNRYIIVDPANAKKKTSDYTVMWVFGVGEDRNYYWLHMLRDRLDPGERIAALIRLHRIYKPLRVGWEEYGMNSDIFWIKKRQEDLNYRFPIVPLGNVGAHRGLSKQDRIRTLIPLYRSGLMYMPEHQTYHTTQGQDIDVAQLFIEKEYTRFPRVSHDDMLDCLARVTDPQMGIEFPIATDVSPQEQPRTPAGRTWMSA